MSKNLKLVALFLISFVGVASVVYQLHNRRPRTTAVAIQPGGASAPAATPVGSPAPVTAAPATRVASSESAVPVPQGIVAPPPAPNGPKTNVPKDVNDWGRNPFLTPQEIRALNEPQLVAEERKEPPKPVEPSALPLYVVSGIVSGNRNRANMAIVDGRRVEPGDRLGSEIVKEVKEQGVVLEREGHVRELLLKPFADAVAPKKETKQ